MHIDGGQNSGKGGLYSKYGTNPTFFALRWIKQNFIHGYLLCISITKIPSTLTCVFFCILIIFGLLVLQLAGPYKSQCKLNGQNFNLEVVFCKFQLLVSKYQSGCFFLSLPISISLRQSFAAICSVLYMQVHNCMKAFWLIYMFLCIFGAIFDEMKPHMFHFAQCPFSWICSLIQCHSSTLKILQCFHSMLPILFTNSCELIRSVKPCTNTEHT